MSIAHLKSQRIPASSRWRARWFALVAASLLGAACGGDGYGGSTGPGDGPPGDPQPTATVQATPSERFTPATVELTAGGTVTFAFGSLAHNVFFDNAPAGAPESIPAATSNQSVTRTFPTAGRYVYNCHLHPGMTGTVNVR